MRVSVVPKKVPGYPRLSIKVLSAVDNSAINKVPSITVEYNNSIYSTTELIGFGDSSEGIYAYDIIKFPTVGSPVIVNCHILCDGYSTATVQAQTTASDFSSPTEVFLTPTTIADEISRLNEAKIRIKASIVGKGVELTDDASINTYANAIRNINCGKLFSKYNYTYNAVADDEGLKAIGWNDDDIDYFKCNNLHLKSENIGDVYKVSSANKVISISNISDVANYKSNTNFKFCPKINCSAETNMGSVFYDCTPLIAIPLLDTSNVEIMANMFHNCTSLITVPPLDTKNVTNMDDMFGGGCQSLISIPLLDTSSVTSMRSMFNSCTSLVSIPQLNTINVANMIGMFSNCPSLTTVPELDAASTTVMDGIFNYCESFTTFGGFKGLKTDLDLSSSPKLTHDSLMNVINKAADVTSSPKTLTLGETNLAKLSNSEKKIATDKGWKII